MNNKVGSIILAVVCFFIGAVLLAEYPMVGALIVFFAEATGFFFGWFSTRDKVKLLDEVENTNEELIEELDKADKEIESLNKTIKNLKAEKKEIVTPKLTKKKESK